MAQSPAVAALLTAICVTAVFAADPQAATIRTKVVSVIDGDTIGVLIGEKEVRVRLEGIDAPERAQEGGPAATKFLRSLVDNQEVTVVQTGTDKYGRMLAKVSTKSGDINSKMIESGHAWHFKKYNSEAALAKLEDRARSQRLGVWVSGSPQAPWDYRKAKSIQEPGTVAEASWPKEEVIPAGKPTTVTKSIPAKSTSPALKPMMPAKLVDTSSVAQKQSQKADPVPKSRKPDSMPSSSASTSPSENPSNRDKRGNYRESAAEKAYEKANGVEVVHKKDGTTYERKARSKK